MLGCALCVALSLVPITLAIKDGTLEEQKQPFEKKVQNNFLAERASRGAKYDIANTPS